MKVFFVRRRILFSCERKCAKILLRSPQWVALGLCLCEMSLGGWRGIAIPTTFSLRGDEGIACRCLMVLCYTAVVLRYL